MLNESLNRFKFDSTHFQQALNIFYAFNNVGRPVEKRPQNLAQQSVERMLNPFNRAIKKPRRQLELNLGVLLLLLRLFHVIMIYCSVIAEVVFWFF